MTVSINDPGHKQCRAWKGAGHGYLLRKRKCGREKNDALSGDALSQEMLLPTASKLQAAAQIWRLLFPSTQCPMLIIPPGSEVTAASTAPQCCPSRLCRPNRLCTQCSGQAWLAAGGCSCGCNFAPRRNEQHQSRQGSFSALQQPLLGRWLL